MVFKAQLSGAKFYATDCVWLAARKGSRTLGAARMTQNELKSHPIKGVLVSEAFTEINAGLVIVLASGESPILKQI